MAAFNVSAVVGVATTLLEVDEGVALLELTTELELEDDESSMELDECELEWCVEDDDDDSEEEELGGGV